MARRRRGKPVPRKRRPRRLGNFLVLVGVLAILGVTFAAGALTGRFSLRPSASGASAKTVERAPRTAPARQPEITFYRELTAPLTPSPLPPKPAVKAPPKLEPAPAPPADGASVVPAARIDAGRYTVQVGSYSVRAQAEAMRARLAGAGHEAYIAEGEAAGVMRYRVRIGAYPNAEEAREAAVRLASEAQVATYVTTW